MSDDNKEDNIDINASDAEKCTTEKKMDDNNSNGGGGGGGDELTKTPNANHGAINFENAPPSGKGLPAPNSKPRDREPAPIETYVYRDFANAEPSALNTETCHKRMPPQSLQNQKLPSKLAAMLSDPDLAAIITWMPHGRSWKILNRELFSSFALPPHFGHSNHASFVRIINAWGFRRISVGIDRDSYYHELFLRGKPRLHERMKRLSSCHRKTPIDKDGKCPDFYELSKTSPLPEVAWNCNTSQRHNSFPGGNAAAATGGGAFPPRLNHSNMMSGGAYMPDAVKPIHFGDASGAFSSMNGRGNGIASGVGGANSSYSMADTNPMASLLGINDSHRGSSNNVAPPNTDASSLNSYTQILQRENENLMLKIKLLEYENQSRQQKQQQDQEQQQLPTTDESNKQNSNFGEINNTGGGALSYNTNANFFNQM
mmetsp:Transcript_3018/g.6602  ORF Transcript_3018/g.6602 Transcript_3018/m.6602 type:complete len:429 (-) Transcript_3018:121-1407(-)|eukprot:CAMPEP_0172306934 /NCGR_PEP_ID=MMETSP1058-20130122/7900_1 /TAXON_ID=83371 /ORGANISM="Detonula confervacea, Strain CCMP 353" /LENGTH=428 /DNA_ID=CAMNT_0013018983 /DNA_START=87 /DNA_END=1373 /DNA_ORIENTATION=+